MSLATSDYLNAPVLSFAEAKARRDERHARDAYSMARCMFEQNPTPLTGEVCFVRYIAYVALFPRLTDEDRAMLAGKRRKQIDEKLALASRVRA